jgi:hypothetical protein
MGFIDYAWAVSFQKDNTKVRILQDTTIDQPTLAPDDYGFTIKLPTVRFLEDGQVSFLGQVFPHNSQGKKRTGRLFRAAVLHLTTHTLTQLPNEIMFPNAKDNPLLAFSKALVRDVYTNAYLQAWYPDRFVDIAFANASFYQRVKPSNRIFAASTRIMTALLTKLNLGVIKGSLDTDEEQVVNSVFQELNGLKDSYLSTFMGEQLDIPALVNEKIKIIGEALDPFGPFLEAPSLLNTENIGRCSVYVEPEANFDFEGTFIGALEALGGTVPAIDSMEQLWRPEQEAEALQAFDSDNYQKERREKILSRISQYVGWTRFKGVAFPDEDYTQYLRARSLMQGAGRRLMDALRSALDLLFEDPRQEMGQLDLTAVIQAMASNKPATDVFELDEYLKQSYAWSIVFDVSSSMKVRGEYGRALAISVGEAAKELMTDPTSWSFFAFSDHLYILKDSTESYSKTVRSRIGGLKFDGLTYMPDAVHMAGKMLAKRYEEQRVLIVISDGWPYGYVNMPIALKEGVDDMLRKGVIVIGIGVQTDRMGNFFRLHTSVYTQKDLVNRFARVYIDASEKALET